MKEVTFIRQNIEKWRDMELIVEGSIEVTPDRQADAYIDLTTDLAFAQTHYPKSRITLYLNDLASALHNQIYRNKRESTSRLVTFWTQEIPQTIWDALTVKNYLNMAKQFGDSFTVSDNPVFHTVLILKRGIYVNKISACQTLLQSA